MTRLFILTPLLLLPLVLFGQEKPEQAAQKPAEHWMELLDAGKYAESWEQAAVAFKTGVGKADWTKKIEEVRKQTGKLTSRSFKSAKYMDNPPNAPAGKYVLLQYDTKFDSGQVIETVVPMQEGDGSWKVSGYFIKPAE